MKREKRNKMKTRLIKRVGRNETEMGAMFRDSERSIVNNYNYNFRDLVCKTSRNTRGYNNNNNNM